MMSTTSTIQGAHEEYGDIDIAGLLRELWGYKWLLLFCMVLGFSIGLLCAMRQPAYYHSNMLIQVDGTRQNKMVFAQKFFSDGSGDSTATQVALIRSRFILEPVAETLGLNTSVSQRFPSVWQRTFSWLYQQNLEVLAFHVPVSEMNKSFQVVIKEGNKVALYNNKSDLILTGEMGKLLTDDTNTVQLEVAKASLPVGTEFNIRKLPLASVATALAGQLSIDEEPGTGILELSLTGTKRAEIPKILSTIAEVAQLKASQRKTEEASQTLEFLEHQLPITQRQLEAAEKKLNAHKVKSGNIDLKYHTQYLLGQLSKLDTRLSEQQLKAEEMRQKYKEEHPIWTTFNNQVAALKKQRAEFELALKKLPAPDQLTANLMRDLEVKQGLYSLLLNKIQELYVHKAGIMSGVRVLGNATTPNAAFSTKTSAFVLGGAGCGLMLGVLFVLIRKFLSPLVEDPHWVERTLNLPNVAIIPFSKAQTTLALKGPRKSLPLLAQSDSKNVVIEALRSLRTTVQVTLPCAENNVISILGIAPGVGKSFVSANLTYLLAAAGKRVVLVDTDLRKGTLHKYFSLGPAPGLSELLLGDLELDDLPSSNSVSENLTVLTRGRYPKNPSELLTGKKFETIVKTLSDRYDIVLFDTPPVLLVTDAVVAARCSATNFLVMGASAHQPNDVEIVMKRLKSAGVSLAGSIFNFHREQLRGSYYGKYYNYSYYEADSTIEE
ncbi:MAG: polysaccharide biosynthesis tyrosine autokinase [Legionellaceae bacterium]|nr:polysaccharide biosynthesis tyrosine autokinase [Legionellaceae bacterium]